MFQPKSEIPLQLAGEMTVGSSTDRLSQELQTECNSHPQFVGAEQRTRGAMGDGMHEAALERCLP